MSDKRSYISYVNEVSDQFLSYLQLENLEHIRDQASMLINQMKMGVVDFDDISRQQSQVYCPIDSTHHIAKNGKDRNNRQRYICKDCGKSFFANNKTLASHLKQDTATWMNFIQGSLEKKTLNELSSECNISIKTAHSWRLRLFYALDVLLSKIKLSGAIVADDTRINYNLKGNHDDEFIMPRKARNRGSSNNKANFQRNSICVLCAIDDNNHSFSKVIGFGNPSGKRIADGFENKIETTKNNILITDGAQAFSKTVKKYNLTQWNRNTTKIMGNKRVPNTSGTYHIQRINALHSRLKSFLRRYKGISSKYLPGYLLLFDYIENNKGADRMFLCKEILYAIATTPALTQDNLENNYIIPVCNGEENYLWETKIPIAEQKVYKMWMANEKIDTIVKKAGVTKRKIYTIRDKVMKYGVHEIIMNRSFKPMRLSRLQGPISEKDLQIFLYTYRDGHSYHNAAKVFGVCRQTISKIVSVLKDRPELQNIKKHPRWEENRYCDEKHTQMYEDFKFLNKSEKTQKDVINLLANEYNWTPKYIYNVIYEFKQKDNLSVFRYRWTDERKSLPPNEYYMFLQERNKKLVAEIERYFELGEYKLKKTVFMYIADKYALSVAHVQRIYYHQSSELHIYDNYLKKHQATAGANSGTGERSLSCS